MSEVVATLGSKIHVSKNSLTPEAQQAIRAAWIFPNPLFNSHRRLLEAEMKEQEKAEAEGRNHRMRFAFRVAPSESISAFEEDDEWLALPRGGGLGRLQAILDALGASLTVRDARCQGEVIDASLAPGWAPRHYQEAAVEAMRRTQRGFVEAGTGCHVAGTMVLMWPKGSKRIEDILPGEAVMGPDSKPRHVLRIIRGHGPCSQVVPKKGEPWIVSDDHVLTLVQTNKSRPRSGQRRKDFLSLDGSTHDIPLKDYIALSPKRKHLLKLFRVPIRWQPAAPLPVDPYFLGILLGDGSVKRTTSIAAGEEDLPIILDECERQGRKWGLKIRIDRSSDRCPSVHFTTGIMGGPPERRASRLTAALRKIGVAGLTSGDKAIPRAYLYADFKSRLEILAGLMDTDGSMSGGGFDYISKSRTLSDGVAFLARSIGLAAYVKPCQKRDQHGAGGTYYRVSISGDCSVVPCRIARKRAPRRQQKKDVLRTGFSITPVGDRDFYGFTLSGDGRYVLEDFTVTHNSGKTVTGVMLIAALKRVTLVVAHTSDILDGWMKEIAGDAQRDTVAKLQGNFRTTRIQGTAGALEAARTGDIILATVQTLYRCGDEVYDVLNKRVGLVLGDEAHHTPAATFWQVFSSLAAKHRHGLTATPKRKDALDFLLHEVIGPKVFEVDEEMLVRDGAIVNPEVEFIASPFYPSVMHKGTNTPNVQRAREIADTSYNRVDLIGMMTKDEARNLLILERVKADWKDGHRIAVLTERVDHAEHLADLFATEGMVAVVRKGGDGNSEIAKKKRRDLWVGVASGKIDVVVGTSVLDEGTDAPTLSSLHLTCPSNNEGLLKQRVGRIRRPKGKQPKVVRDYIDFRCKAVRRSYEQRRKWYRRWGWKMNTLDTIKTETPPSSG